MTDHINSVLVILDKDIKDDDACQLVDALLMIKGVSSVVPNTSKGSDVVAQQRERGKVIEKLYKVIEELGAGI